MAPYPLIAHLFYLRRISVNDRSQHRLIQILELIYLILRYLALLSALLLRADNGQGPPCEIGPQNQHDKLEWHYANGTGLP
jgi:hypothetical protein